MQCDISFFIPVWRDQVQFTSCIVTGVILPLFSVTKWIQITTMTQVTLELGLLLSKKDSRRVVLPITWIWADKQGSQPLQWCFLYIRLC